MKILLDTHVFLWWVMDNPQLTETARKLIADGRNQLFLSAASGWEIAIKAQRGRIQLPDSPERFVSSQLALNAVMALPVLMSHALHVFHLPPLHQDPFDRLLIAQAQVERLPILTLDHEIAQYEVEVVGTAR